MPQNQDYSDLDFDNGVISQELQQISDNFTALMTAHSGTTAPSGVNQGAFWLDTSGTTYQLKQLNHNDTWVTIFEMDRVGRDIVNTLLQDYSRMSDLWEQEHNFDGSHKTNISANISEWIDGTFTINSVSAVDTFTVASDQTGVFLPEGQKGRMVEVQQPSNTIWSPVENATYDSNNDETTVTLGSARTDDLDDTETIDDIRYGTVGPSNEGALPLVSNSKLINSDVTVTAGTALSGGGSVSLGDSTTLNVSGVSTSEVDFTDQQLGTGDSPTFSGASFTDQVEHLDNGTSSPLMRISADDEVPFALVIGNDTFSTTSDQGIAFFVGNDGTATIDARGAGGSLQFDASGGVVELDQNITDFQVEGATVKRVGTLQFSDVNGDGYNASISEDSSGRLSFDVNGFGDVIKMNNAVSGGISSSQGLISLFGNNTIDPDSETNYAKIYGKGGEMWVIDDTGNTTLLSSHDNEGNYFVKHKSPKREIRQEIDVEKAIKFLEEKFGKDFIREYDLEAN
jgi:hypothetical protein